MNVAIIHYHLHPGGVTRIIYSQVSALQKTEGPGELKILSGDVRNPDNVSGVPVLYNALLGYHEEFSGEEILKDCRGIKNYIRQVAGDFLLHVHNASLVKNPALSLAVHDLALEGMPVLNHYHDFAEDRTENSERLLHLADLAGLTPEAILYPSVPACHFAVLNTCDFSRILSKGIPAARVHLLPNPVSVPLIQHKDRQALRLTILQKLGISHEQCMLVTYPVRGIRRKNLGEFILLAAVNSETCFFVITQPPRNLPEIPSYERWKKFAAGNHLPVLFEAGEKVDHEELIRISDFCITTSIQEGFGMAFIEPWLSETPVAGRNIPCVTEDLMQSGLELPRLYDHMWVSGSHGRRDFCTMPVEEQESFISGLIKSRESRDAFLQTNPFLTGLFTRIDPGIISRNRQTILANYSVNQYGKRLLAIYQNIPG
jgi:glycosyltransferase involved in cell wall biosynthesis